MGSDQFAIYLGGIIYIILKILCAQVSGKVEHPIAGHYGIVIFPILTLIAKASGNPTGKRRGPGNQHTESRKASSQVELHSEWQHSVHHLGTMAEVQR